MDRVTVKSSRIERWQLRPGDHIYVWRKITVTDTRFYSHHGIYESDEKVIQLTSALPLSSVPATTCSRCRKNMCKGGVVIYCLDCFLQGGELCLFTYAVPLWFWTQRKIDHPHPQPSCSMEAEDPPETVLRRANHLHDVVGFGTYDPLTNNCFHFAFYCKTGRRYDGPVTLVVVTSDDSAALPLRVPPQYVVAPPQYVVAPPPPPPPSPPRRRDRDWDWGRFELPQPSFRTIAAVGAVGALVVLMPELAPFAFI